MDRQKIPTLEMPDITVNDIRPIVESLFERMTQKQWQLIQSGDCCDETLIIFADTLLHLISLLSRSLLRSLTGRVTQISDNNIRTSLGDSLSQSFFEVLSKLAKDQDKADDKDQTISLDQLTDCIVEEVTHNINASLSTPSPSAEPPVGRTTPPEKLQKMVRHTSNLFEAITAKIKRRCKPLKCTWRRDQTVDMKIVDTASDDDDDDVVVAAKSLDCVDEEDISAADTDQLSVRSEPEATSSSMLPQEKTESDICKDIESIIDQEFSPILENLLADVPAAQYDQMKSETSEEIRMVAHDFIECLITDVVNLVEASSDAGETGSMDYALNFKRATGKLKKFFAKRFEKASLLQMVTRLKSKFQQAGKVESAESVQSLTDNVESLLLTEDKNQEGVKEQPHTVITDSRPLSNHLYSYFNREEIVRSPGQATPNTTTIPAPLASPEMYADIQSEVISHMSLVNWWAKSQTPSILNRVTFSLVDNQPLITSTQAMSHLSVTPVVQAGSYTPASPAEEVTVLSEVAPVEVVDSSYESTMVKNKVLVRTLTEALVGRVFRKAKVGWSIKDPKDSIQSLYQKIMACLDNKDFNLISKKLNRLDKLIYNDLCKTWPSTLQVLAEVTLMTPELEDAVISSLRRHLTPPKPSAISRFFSSVQKAFSNPFRRTKC